MLFNSMIFPPNARNTITADGDETPKISTPVPTAAAAGKHVLPRGIYGALFKNAQPKVDQGLLLQQQAKFQSQQPLSNTLLKQTHRSKETAAMAKTHNHMCLYEPMHKPKKVTDKQQRKSRRQPHEKHDISDELKHHRRRTNTTTGEINRAKKIHKTTSPSKTTTTITTTPNTRDNVPVTTTTTTITTGGEGDQFDGFDPTDEAVSQKHQDVPRLCSKQAEEIKQESIKRIGGTLTDEMILKRIKTENDVTTHSSDTKQNEVSDDKNDKIGIVMNEGEHGKQETKVKIKIENEDKDKNMDSEGEEDGDDDDDDEDDEDEDDDSSDTEDTRDERHTGDDYADSEEEEEEKEEKGKDYIDGGGDDADKIDGAPQDLDLDSMNEPVEMISVQHPYFREVQEKLGPKSKNDKFCYICKIKREVDWESLPEEVKKLDRYIRNRNSEITDKVELAEDIKHQFETTILRPTNRKADMEGTERLKKWTLRGIYIHVTEHVNDCDYQLEGVKGIIFRALSVVEQQQLYVTPKTKKGKKLTSSDIKVDDKGLKMLGGLVRYYKDILVLGDKFKSAYEDPSSGTTGSTKRGTAAGKNKKTAAKGGNSVNISTLACQAGAKPASKLMQELSLKRAWAMS
jgi:hypothetical protein